MTSKLLKIPFWRENVKILQSFAQFYNELHYKKLKICKQLVVYRFYCMALYHSQTRRHLINEITSLNQKAKADLSTLSALLSFFCLIILCLIELDFFVRKPGFIISKHQRRRSACAF